MRHQSVQRDRASTADGTAAARAVDQVSEIRRRLLDWYAVNQRQLPWRGASDPYAILVSEFMLQQTGVDRVRPIFEAFLQTFPSFQALADSPRIGVLRAWAGLGYNRRAVHLHECAQSVVREHGGVLPRDADQLRSLPGVGPYTAAAIQSFVYHDDVATIDTNVRRVVGRLLFPQNPSEKVLARSASELIPPGRSADWNQALMDFGSAQCTVANPPCLLCPLLDLCASGPVTTSVSAERKVAERGEPFLGSRRYLRGRIVAHLRSLESGDVVPVSSVVAAIGLESNPSGPELTAELARQLADDGLARIDEGAEGLLVGPPI